MRLGDPFCIAVPNSVSIGVAVAEISRFFCDFQDGGRRHLEFSKIRNFNGLSPVGSECASPCQISSWVIWSTSVTVESEDLFLSVFLSSLKVSE